MNIGRSTIPPAGLDLDAISRYRRDGYLVVPGVLDPSHVEQCLAALGTLAADPGLVPGRCDGTGAFIALEPAADDAIAASLDRADLIRNFGDFTDASRALLRAAMLARLHMILDVLMGQGRVLLQEMALVKPPKVSGEKPWHQDAAYFRGSDTNLMFGVWIALDPATRQNGCMQVIPGSHLRGPAPHVPAEDINLCTIRPDLVRLDERVALAMDPGDVLIFHSLIHHYTAANYSDRRRRALQFHYHQVGTGLDVTGGPSGAVSWRGWSLRGLHRAEGRTVCRSLQLRSQPVAAGRADGIGLSGETLA